MKVGDTSSIQIEYQKKSKSKLIHNFKRDMSSTIGKLFDWVSLQKKRVYFFHEGAIEDRSKDIFF
jgi:hypothetical protein